MDITLEIILAMMVLIIVSAILMLGFNVQIEGFSSDADSLEERGCEFQRERVDDPSQLSDRCQEESSTDSQNNDDGG